MKRKLLVTCLLSLPLLLTGCNNKGGDTVTFTYDVNYEGGENRVQTLKRGEKATYWEARRSEYTLEGWYTNKDLKTEFDFSTPINEDTTIYAKREEEQVEVPVTVTFDYSYNDKVLTSQIEYYSGQVLPEDFAPQVERLGFEVEGWYLEKTYHTKFNFNIDILTEDITLYAKYNSISNFTYNEDGSIKFDNVRFNFAINDMSGMESTIQTLVRNFNIEYRDQILVTVVDNQITANSEITAKIQQAELTNQSSDFHTMEEVLELANIEFDESDYYSLQIQDCYMDGNLHTLPVGSWVPHIVYNKNVMQTYNGSNSLPSNYNEWVELANKITESKRGDTSWYHAITADAAWNYTEISGNNAYIQNDSPHYELDELTNKYVNNWIDTTNGGMEKALNALKAQYTYFGDNVDGIQIGTRKGDYGATENGVVINMPGLTAVGEGNALVGLVGRFDARDYYKTGAGISDDSKISEKLGILPLSNFFAIDEDNPNANKIFVKNLSYGVTDSGPDDLYKKAAAAVFGDYLTKHLGEVAGDIWLYPASKTAQNDEKFLNSNAYKYYLQYAGDPSLFYTLPGTANEYNIFNKTMETLLGSLFNEFNYDEDVFKEILNAASSTINAYL